MEAAQRSFYQLNLWTERIGPTAALKTLEIMERERSWEVITKKDRKFLVDGKLIDKYDLDIITWGLPALSGFTFNFKKPFSYKTLITQEMLKKGYLAANSIYVCTEHSQELINGYFECLEPIFSIIKDCEEGLAVESLLEGPDCHSGFKRLN